jgi:fatty-acyl-CoA synthase
MSLVESLTSCPNPAGRLRTWDAGSPVDSTWDAVVRDAHGMAADLREIGVERGRPVAAVITNSAAAVRGILAIWLAGGSVASLPIRARGMSAGDYSDELVAIQARLEAPVFLAAQSVLDGLPADFIPGTAVRAWESLKHAGHLEGDPPSDGEVAFIQYSSGSTSAPKGCMLTAGAITAQVEIIYGLLDTAPGDRATMCSWLPLSHDMGIFGGLLMPWSAGIDVWLSSPERFIMGPATWFADLADAPASLSLSPNMGLDVAVRAAARASRLPGDVAGLRSIVIGGERVEWRTLRAAEATFGPCGLRSRMLQPAYGLAENTLAVTAVAIGEDPSYVSLDGRALADGLVEEIPDEHPGATRVVSCGWPQAGCEVDAQEDALSPIRISSPSLADGYHRDDKQTAERFRDGWLDTRDLGFMRDGQLYVVGRSDDVLTIAGRNVYATEIETAVGALEGIRTGCCTIVDVRDEDSSRLVMVLELNGKATEPAALAREAARISMRKAGITLSECVVVARGAIPKTPSGKVQRFRTRQLLSSASLEPLSRVVLRAA